VVIASHRTANQCCVTSQKSEDLMNGLFPNISLTQDKYRTSIVSNDWVISENAFERVCKQEVLF
jgi:hypothetical protein